MISKFHSIYNLNPPEVDNIELEEIPEVRSDIDLNQEYQCLFEDYDFNIISLENEEFEDIISHEPKERV